MNMKRAFSIGPALVVSGGLPILPCHVFGQEHVADRRTIGSVTA